MSPLLCRLMVPKQWWGDLLARCLSTRAALAPKTKVMTFFGSIYSHEKNFTYECICCECICCTCILIVIKYNFLNSPVSTRLFNIHWDETRSIKHFCVLQHSGCLEKKHVCKGLCCKVNWSLFLGTVIFA